MSSSLQSADVSAPKRVASVIAAFRQRMLIPAQIAVSRAVRTFAPLGTLRSPVPVLIGLTLLSSLSLSFAQTTPPTVPPALGTAGVNCVISAANRNAVVEIDGGYSIFNIPANAGAFRGRVTCSDGSVGQTPVKFSSVVGGTVIELGDIVWGKIDPVPTALGLTAPVKRLTTGGTSQLSASAIGINPDNSATTYDVTQRSKGTTYTISNDLMGTISQEGLVTILAAFASGSSSRVVLNASAEGGATGSYMFTLGPRGSLSGRVYAADGVTPIASAQVSALRTQPREQAGTVTTDAGGNFTLPDVNAGPFQLTAIDPVTGDRATAPTQGLVWGAAGVFADRKRQYCDCCKVGD